jgi:hypothetical protein
MAHDTLNLDYEFTFPGGDRKTFRVQLQKPGLGRVLNERASLPEWTRLGHHRCPNCPLDPARHPHCPVAANLVEVIEAFRDRLSTEETDIVIRHESREYHRRAPVQYGVSSLMGLHMVTSGCPILDKLRPMAATHLPFATIEETTYRAVSMYLLAQFFRMQRGQEADWKLQNLVRICEDIGKVNQAFSKRILSINPQDASLNAIANLDCFSTVTALSIVRDNLKELEALFAAHLDDAQSR